MNYAEHLNSKYWAVVAKEVKDRAGWRCQVCNSPHDLAAHHRTYENRGNELDHLDDLICLCRRCHAIFHGKTKIYQSKPEKQTKQVIQQPQKKIELEPFPEMPAVDGDGMIELTAELLEKCRTRKFGLTNRTGKALGQSLPLSTGWFKKMIGKKITPSQWRDALVASNRYTTQKTK